MISDNERRKIDEQKRIFELVTKEWLDDKFATFGRWTFRAMMAISFIALLKAIMHLNGHDLRSAIDAADFVR